LIELFWNCWRLTDKFRSHGRYRRSASESSARLLAESLQAHVNTPWQ
jgi:hypothetical protein